MNDEVILALDQGTTSSRTLAFDRAGKLVAVAQREFEQHFPQLGWVEHDGEEIWVSQEWTLQEVMGQLQGRKVAGMGITNQRETTLVWDRKTGEPLHRAIVWQDRRTAEFCVEMKEKGLEELFAAKTGLRLDPNGTDLSVSSAF